MHDLTAAVPDGATLIRDDSDTVIGAVWRADGAGPWPGEAWKLATLAHGKTTSVRETEHEAISYVLSTGGL